MANPSTVSWAKAFGILHWGHVGRECGARRSSLEGSLPRPCSCPVVPATPRAASPQDESVYRTAMLYATYKEALQILLALVTAGLGAVLAYHSVEFSTAFPLVYLTGYPCWGALTFVLTGYLTLWDKRSPKYRRCVLAMNIVSCVVAGAGITLTMVSYTQQHKICQGPSLEGMCVVSRTLLLGILSVLLITSIVEFSISVTVLSFQSKCWTRPDEVVLFLPSDVTQNTKRAAQEENALLQFDLQEESSSNDATSNRQAVFFGGYVFFKLRLSRNPLGHQHGSQPHLESSAPAANEPPPLKSSEEHNDLERLSSTPDVRAPGHTVHTQRDSLTTQPDDKAVKHALVQTEAKVSPCQDHDLPFRPSLPSFVESAPVLPVEVLPPKPLLMQALPTQDAEPETLASLSREPHHQPNEGSPSRDTQAQGTPQSQEPPQAVRCEASTSQPVPSPGVQHLLQLSPEPQPPHSQARNNRSSVVIYQDILTEVMELTQQWKVKGESFDKKSTKRHSFDKGNKAGKSQKRHSLDLQRKGTQGVKRLSLDLQRKNDPSPRRKSLDQQIKALLSTKKHLPEKKSQYTQTSEQFPDQPAEGQQAKQEQSPKQESAEGTEGQGLQTEEEKLAEQQPTPRQADGQHAHTERAPMRLCEDRAFPEKRSLRWTTPDWQYSGHQGQDWRSQGWRNKEWKTQAWQFDMQPYLNWESQEKEALRQRALYQDPQTTTAQHGQDWRLQDSDQQDPQWRAQLRTHEQTDSVPARGVKLEDVSCGGPRPTDPQSGEPKSGQHPASSQSVVQDTYAACLYSKGSEQEVQDPSACSGSPEDDTKAPSTPCSLRNPQQSEDSD